MSRKVTPPDTEYTLSDQQRMEAAHRYFQWQYRLAEPHIGRRVLEVGCGVGNVTKLLLDRELVVGIDIEERCVNEHTRRFSGHANVVSRILNVLDPQFKTLSRHRVDSVVCLNVLEHIDDDKKALENMHAVLQPGGKVILIVPAFESLYGPIDANLGHYRRYSRSVVAELASAIGFEVASLHYMNVVGLLGWWFNARILRKEEQSDAQIRLFDRWIVPLVSTAESIVRPPCGQNVFAVLRKVDAVEKSARPTNQHPGARSSGASGPVQRHKVLGIL